MLELVIVDLGSQLFMISYKDGMFNSGEECGKGMCLEHFSRFFAKHDLRSHTLE